MTTKTRIQITDNAEQLMATGLRRMSDLTITNHGPDTAYVGPAITAAGQGIAIPPNSHKPVVIRAQKLQMSAICDTGETALLTIATS